MQNTRVSVYYPDHSSSGGQLLFAFGLSIDRASRFRAHFFHEQQAKERRFLRTERLRRPRDHPGERCIEHVNLRGRGKIGDRVDQLQVYAVDAIEPIVAESIK